jgi:ferritin
VTEQITKIFSLAREESAWHIEVAFQWFITEQVEEEATARDNLAKIGMVGSNPAALLGFDRNLSAQ